MKAPPLIIHWHDQNAPVYSAHFEPGGKGRLATAGGDNHVRIWKVESDGLERKIDYLSTLSKHNQAVNVVRWAPKGMFASRRPEPVLRPTPPLLLISLPSDADHEPLPRRGPRLRW